MSPYRVSLYRVSSIDTEQRPLRADAERNRRRILTAAAELFATRGLDVSLDDIADHAGVGVGTVYRRFADRDALIDALFEVKVAEVADRAREALLHDDPWEGFAMFMSGVCAEQALDRGFKEAMLSHEPGRKRVARARETIEPLATRVIRRAQRSGQLRADLDPLDVPLMNMMLGGLADTTRSVDPDYWRRALQIVLDGLAVRRDRPTPLPAAPLDRAGFETAMTRRGR